MNNRNINDVDGLQQKKLAQQIAGEISLADNPGDIIKKWRDIFKISQKQLAQEMEVMPSVISDYENGRRQSPGVGMVNKIVSALLTVDANKGGRTIREFSSLTQPSTTDSDFLEVREFDQPCSIEELMETIGGQLMIDSRAKKIYGYTLINSMKTIQELSSSDLVKIYGSTTERALIFSNITRGRAPLVAIKVTSLKPGLVVLHGLDEDDVDPLAVRIAEAEGIPLGYATDYETRQIKNRLKTQLM